MYAIYAIDCNKKELTKIECYYNSIDALNRINSFIYEIGLTSDYFVKKIDDSHYNVISWSRKETIGYIWNTRKTTSEIIYDIRIVRVENICTNVEKDLSAYDKVMQELKNKIEKCE